MAIEIVVPRLGWSMDEGTFVQWLKREGEMVHEGDFLFELESDKATQNVESFDSGVLRLPADAPQSGDTVKVGQCLGYLCGAEESVAASCSSDSGVTSQSDNHATIQEDVLAVAKESEPCTPGDSGNGLSAYPRLAVSPRAASRAAQMGVTLAEIAGTGRGGRIRERDVLAASRAPKQQVLQGDIQTRQTPAQFPDVGTLSSSPSARSVPSSSTRATIAKRMLAASQQTAPVTLMVKADASGLISLRKEFKQASDTMEVSVPSVTSMLVKLVAVALQKHPEILRQWAEEGLLVPDGIHIAVAVDTERGLLTPVLRNVPSLPLGELTKYMSAAVERARAGKLTREELEGGTFTLSNLGGYAVDFFTPILNLPQSAILGIGRIRPEPVVQGEEIVVRDQVSLSLTFDHRVYDGATAAAFLQTLCKILQCPGPWLMQ